MSSYSKEAEELKCTLERVRSEVASYQFEADLVRSSARALSTNYVAQLSGYGSAAAQLGEVKDCIDKSKVFKYARKLVSFIHGLRGRGDYSDPFSKLAVPPPLAASSPIRIPEVSAELKQLLQIPDSVVDVGKSWDQAEFKSFYFYNELDRILSREKSAGRPIFIQSPIIDWFVPLYQRPQHLALAMAKRGYLVFYMTANTLGDAARGFHEVEENVFLTNQPVHMMVNDALISFYSTVATLLAWREEIPEIRARGSKILYEYIDHIDPEISFGTTDLLAKQLAIVDSSTVDLVAASADVLMEEIAETAAGVPSVYVANGVDTNHYERHLANNRLIVPAAMREIIGVGRPVVGYFGAMAPWLWYPVINEMARLRPDLSFVYIGPDYLGGMEQVECQPNVYLLGAIDYSILPYYSQHFDVALIPFKPGDIAKSTSPLKLFEYFAMGVPVVVTRGMLECEKYSEVDVAGGAEEFIQKIDAALMKREDYDFKRALAVLAQENSWDARAAALIHGHDMIRGVQ